MCGRFTQRFTPAQVQAFLSLLRVAQNLPPRYNIAPGQRAAVVRDEDTGRRLEMLRWGLVPGWASDLRIAYKCINARSETAHAKPAFRAAFRARRCLVPVDGFYEWSGKGTARQAWLIELPGAELFALAGLWERWRVRENVPLPAGLAGLVPGDVLQTFTILTTQAHPSLAAIHPRMPVIVAPHDLDRWLTGEDVALGPTAGLVARRVGSRVNDARHDDPSCVAPADAA